MVGDADQAAGHGARVWSIAPAGEALNDVDLVILKSGIEEHPDNTRMQNAIA